MTDIHEHVIVGGGFAGLRAARMLANRDDVAVTLINPQSNFEYHGSLYRSANGYSPLETVVPYREIFQDSTARYIQDFMVDIDPGTKQIKLLSGESISYDSATLALGYEPEYFGIPGMREFSKTLYSLADALELRKLLTSIAHKSFHKVASARVIVAGGGPTGVEVAASIPYFFELITGDARVEVSLVEAQDEILGGLGIPFAKAVRDALSDDITVICGQKVIRASKESLHIAGKAPQPFDILIWTAGSSANSYFRQRSDLFETDRKGRVLVNEFLQTKHDSVYVVGDSAAVAHSGTAHAAIEMGGYVAEHVIASISGQACPAFNPSEPPYAVPTGHETAVATQAGELVSGAAGWKIRRQLDLDALQLIAPGDVALTHWQKGDSVATMFSPTEQLDIVSK